MMRQPMLQIEYESRIRTNWAPPCLLAALFLLFAVHASADGLQWTQVANPAPWGNPFSYLFGGAPQVLNYHDGMYAFNDPENFGDPTSVWTSSDGTSWTLIKQAIPIQGNVPTALTVFKNKLWAFARYQSTPGNHILSSEDGVAWRPEGTAVPWATKLDKVYAFNDKLWAIDWSNNIFASNNGTSWTQITPALPAYHDHYPVFAVFNGKLWILGGGDSLLNDVWSSPDGMQWNLETAHAAWSPRWGAEAFVHGGRLWIANGWNGTKYSNDIWSSLDGVNWTQAAASFPTYNGYFSGFRGKIWMFNTDGQMWRTQTLTRMPLLMAAPNEQIVEGLPYSAAPSMFFGESPVTWSLIAPPSGMTINKQTGTVSWPWAFYRTDPYRVRVRATNTFGSGETSWTLSVTPQPPPVLSVPRFTSGTQATVNWTVASPFAGFTVQRDVTADFTAPQSTTVSSATLHHTFTELQDGQTYYYRVRADKVGGLGSLWSNVTSSTQDGVAPAGSVALDPRASEWPLVGAVRLILTMSDPGPRASGLSQMRFGTDGKNWKPWQPFKPAVTAWLGSAGTFPVYVQVRDAAGNIKQLSTPAVTVGALGASFVDAANTAGPWTGVLAHPFRKIQDAIDAATPGATIVTAPGTYKENIQFKGKNVVLRSIDPESPDIVRSTIIDGQYADRAVLFAGTETAACTLAGFTITRGRHYQIFSLDAEDPPPADDPYGGGIYGHHTHAAILNNRIVGNCIFVIISVSLNSYEGYTSYEGYGGALAECDGPIRGNIIASNIIGDYVYPYEPPSYGAKPGKPRYPPPGWGWDYDFEYGGSALCNCGGTIEGNTFWNNSSQGQASTTLDDCHGTIRNNIIVSNSVHAFFGSSSAPEYCCFSGGGGLGNIGADPRLADPANGDFHLLPDSPCIDAGGFTPGLRDIDGEARGWVGAAAGRGDGSGFDIGADEYQPPSPAIWVTAPQGGEALHGRDALTVQWRTDPARAGSNVLIRLYQGRVAIATLGTGTGTAGTGSATVHLPLRQGHEGNDYAIKLISVQNPGFTAISPPFTILKPNGVARESWEGYQ